MREIDQKPKKSMQKITISNVVEDHALTATQPLNPNELNRITLSANCNARTTTIPSTTTTITLAATSKTKNCRGLIQKRAHTLDDFMEGNK